jgi:hypothetical protein
MSTIDPITPPPLVREQWHLESPFKVISLEREDYMIDRAAQWGAGQELKACCEWITGYGWSGVAKLRAARRPEPPSLKQQALKALTAIEGDFNTVGDHADTIRRALEALDD